MWTITCVKLWPVKLTLYPLGPPPGNLPKNTGLGSIFIVPHNKWTLRMHREQEEPQTVQKIFRGENVDTKLKKATFPTDLSPDKVCSPPPHTHTVLCEEIRCRPGH